MGQAASFTRSPAPTVTYSGSSKKGWKRKYDNRESTVVQLASTVENTPKTLSPNLKFLRLTELSFFKAILFGVFKRGLQQRMKVSGALLKFLGTIDCDIITEHANDLRKLVQDFDWDETEGLIDKDGIFDTHERDFYDGEDIFVDQGTALPDRDSDGDDENLDGDDSDEWGM